MTSSIMPAGTVIRRREKLGRNVFLFVRLASTIVKPLIFFLRDIKTQDVPEKKNRKRINAKKPVEILDAIF